MKRLVSFIALICAILLFSDLNAHAAGKRPLKDLKTLGVFLNYNNPNSSLDQGYDSDYSAGIKVGYGLTNEIGAALSFSSFKFDGKKSVGSYDTLTIDSWMANLFYKFDTTTNLYPLATAGVGYYMVNEGADNLGVNFGLGIITDLVDLSEMFSFDLSWNYHHIFNKGKDSSFFEIKAGLNFNFF